jgi:hypothetical protein
MRHFLNWGWIVSRVRKCLSRPEFPPSDAGLVEQRVQQVSRGGPAGVALVVGGDAGSDALLVERAGGDAVQGAGGEIAAVSAGDVSGIVLQKLGFELAMEQVQGGRGNQELDDELNAGGGGGAGDAVAVVPTFARGGSESGDGGAGDSGRSIYHGVEIGAGKERGEAIGGIGRGEHLGDATRKINRGEKLGGVRHHAAEGNFTVRKTFAGGVKKM